MTRANNIITNREALEKLEEFYLSELEESRSAIKWGKTTIKRLEKEEERMEDAKYQFEAFKDYSALAMVIIILIVGTVYFLKYM